VQARFPWAWVGLFALLKLALHLATASNYGWHIDELYFIASSQHLDWGYVDYPPLVPLLARLDQALFAGSLVALRALPALAGAAIVVVTALIARELGGSPRAQAWAALMALLSPMFIGANVLFHTTTFDQLTWTIALLVFVRLLRDQDPRLWLALGVAIGVGLETKFTIAALPVALLAGLLATRRRAVLLSPWPWAGAAIALAMLVPNLVWQSSHEWISLQYTLSHRGHTDGPLAYWAQQILLIGPLFLVPCVLGLLALRKDPRFAPIPFVALAVELIFFAAGGKSYYVGPVLPIAYAAGALWLDARLRARVSSRVAVTASLALTLVLLPIGVPILPTKTFVDSGLWKVRQDFANMLGGPELARKTAAAYDSIPPDQRPSTIVVAHWYGEAGPINLYGPSLGLPQAVSPHLSFWYWAPARMDPQTVVLVGYTRADANRYFADCRQSQTITNDYGIQNDFSGDPILICTQPREPLWKVWPSLQALD
jgi:4-amino-4-deoxy-L-arabinose transferase-like glycosyltransferase